MVIGQQELCSKLLSQDQTLFGVMQRHLVLDLTSTIHLMLDTMSLQTGQFILVLLQHQTLTIILIQVTISTKLLMMLNLA